MAEFEPDPNHPLRVVGRYALYGRIASGGMATVHFGRLLGPVGFSRTVAIKRLHPQFSKDPEFVAMFLDEARLAARIQHPNVVATVDVVAMEEELFLVMDYVRGEAFSRLLRGAKRQNIEIPEGFIANVVACMLHGLHAAHEATDERGQPLCVVHRDVSPQNVLVGIDGVARVLDFGVAKAAARVQVTRDGQMKGKLAYMSPEQLSGVSVDRRTDVFAAGVVLWEALTGERLFTGDDASAVLNKILRDPVPPPSSVNPKVRRELDRLVLRALDKNPETRFQTAREFAIAIEEAMPLMSPRSVGEWVERIAGESLERREQWLAEIESVSSVNELSMLTPSDPGFMKTLKTQVRGAPLLPRRPSQPGKAPPPLQRSRKPAPPPLPAEEDAATTIYAGPGPHEPPPLPPPKPGSEVPTLPPPVIIAEPPQAFEPPPSDTDLGPNPFRPSSPFRGESAWRAYAMWAGGGMVAVGVLYFLISAIFSPSEVSLETPRSKKPVVEEAPPPVADKPVDAIDPSELPPAEETDPSGHDEPPPETKPQKKTGTSTATGGETKKPIKKPAKGDCSQPWFVDAQGIRRIKSECL